MEKSKIYLVGESLQVEKDNLLAELKELGEFILEETDQNILSLYEQEKKEILEDIGEVDKDIEELSEFVKKFNELSAENSETNKENIDADLKLEIEKPNNNLEEIENINQEVVNSIDESSKKEFQKFESEKIESIDNQQNKYPQKKKKNQKVQNQKSKSSK